MSERSDNGVLTKSPSELSEADIIYDWNSLERRGSLFKHKISFFDETLRDGVQCPSVVDPKIEDKIKLVHLMDDVGIDHVDIGLPGAGRRAFEDTMKDPRFIKDVETAKIEFGMIGAATLAQETEQILQTPARSIERAKKILE